jgi:predicted nucleic acid-binding protein
LIGHALIAAALTRRMTLQACKSDDGLPVIDLDTSVAPAVCFVKAKRPPTWIATAELISSRLLHYEMFVRLNAQRASPAAFKTAQSFLNRTTSLDLDPPTLARALQPFPKPLQTLDAMHLATMSYLQARGLTIELATYDQRFGEAAEAFGIRRVGM